MSQIGNPIVKIIIKVLSNDGDNSNAGIMIDNTCVINQATTK